MAPWKARCSAHFDVFPVLARIRCPISGSISLVIQKDTLQNPDLQEPLGRKSEKQVKVLPKYLVKILGQVIVVFNLLGQIQAYVEKYRRENGHYAEAYDSEPTGYTLVETA